MNACVHLGEVTGETVRCSNCRGRVELKLFGCSKFGQCTLAQAVPSVPCCGQCSSYEPGPEIPMASPRWCVGVTTVLDRKDTYLPRTLKSLTAGGFPPPWLFVDGSRYPDMYSQLGIAGVTVRWPKVRSYGNWVLGLWEMLVRNPECDRFAVFQDDAVCIKNLRQYLDRCIYPAENARAAGYWNLFSLPGNEALAKGRRGWYESNQRGWGAVGLVFNRAAVLEVLSQKHTVERPLDPAWGHRKIDGGIVTSMMKAGHLEYVHAPSLVQHIGEVSAMGNAQHRPPQTFPGEDFDALGL